MSDNDTTEDTSTDETIEFSGSHFGEDAIDETSTETDTSTEPATDKAETTETDADKPADESTEDKPADEATPDEVTTEDKSDVDLKGMSRAERAAYFQSQKQEQQREVGQVINQIYRPQNVTELQQAYLNDNPGLDEGTALILARQDVAEQKAQIAEATTEIAELNANLRVDSFEAQAAYDWMNPTKTDSYDTDAHEAAAQIFSQGITTDPRTGQIIEARMTPKQAADIVDKIRNSGNAKAQLAAQKAAEAQLAAVAPPTSSAPPSGNESEDDKRAARLAQKFGV
jgi:hypothetical protein